ncbi:hypothetical protein ABDD95_12825 [Mucilaginibacter sp. PAMB04274]|uniref:hypothetical protein n=1 Tax=Mucilaginibacter sp. PAMB04274 TaxID=3138568 RepID=UPI0031F64808
MSENNFTHQFAGKYRIEHLQGDEGFNIQIYTLKPNGEAIWNVIESADEIGEGSVVKATWNAEENMISITYDKASGDYTEDFKKHQHFFEDTDVQGRILKKLSDEIYPKCR